MTVILRRQQLLEHNIILSDVIFQGQVAFFLVLVVRNLYRLIFFRPIRICYFFLRLLIFSIFSIFFPGIFWFWICES